MKEKDFYDENSTKSHSPLFKHMPLVYALDLLQNCRLWFASPETWTDPFEQRFYSAQYENPSGTGVTPFPWKGKVFCTCFTTRAASEAHWKRGSDDSVMLHFSREKLLRLLKNLPNDLHVYIGKVEYMQTKEIQVSELSKIPFKRIRPSVTNIDNYCARLLLLKRNAFLYEEEIRVMIFNKNATYQQKGDFLLEWSKNDVLTPEVTLSPLQSKEANQNLKEFINANYLIKVLFSRLYKAPKPRKIMKW